MLAQLASYARSHGLTVEPGFKAKTVRWAIVCGPGGAYHGLQGLGIEGPKNRGKDFPCCPHLSFSDLMRGGAGCRHFLVDQVDVVARLSTEPDPKLDAKHAYFVDLLARLGREVPALADCAALLRNPDSLATLQADLVSRKAKPTELITFAHEDREDHDSEDSPFLVDRTDWHEGWRRFRRTLDSGEGREADEGGEQVAATARCLASGDLITPLSTYPKINGLADVGGHSAGDTLASFKQESFRSYGLEQGANAPMSEDEAAAFAAGLNDILKHHSERIGSHFRIAHWFRDRVAPEHDLRAQYQDPEDLEFNAQRVAARLLAAFRLGEQEKLAANRYFVLFLSGASGRVVVRDWFEGTFADLARAQQAWFEDLSIVHRDGTGLDPDPKIAALFYTLVRDLDDLAPALIAALWRAAFRPNVPFPHQALALALDRFRADLIKDQKISTIRMGLMKACLLRSPVPGETAMTPYLNPEHPAKSYQCGRLLAVLAEVQRRALGDVGAGVVQRYYAAASITPDLVLGRLIRNANFHLDKLDRDKPGARKRLEGQIAEIQARLLDEVPKTLSLRDQSLFALGYYQQLGADRAATAERNAAWRARRGGDATTEPDVDADSDSDLDSNLETGEEVTHV